MFNQRKLQSLRRQRRWLDPPGIWQPAEQPFGNRRHKKGLPKEASLSRRLRWREPDQQL